MTPEKPRSFGFSRRHSTSILDSPLFIGSSSGITILPRDLKLLKLFLKASGAFFSCFLPCSVSLSLLGFIPEPYKSKT